MPIQKSRSDSQAHYSVGAVVRATGISADLLRAWERRYGAIQPERTAGGTRRYSVADIERLQLLKAAVDAGHRISALAALDMSALESLASAPQQAPSPSLDQVMEALDALDGPEAERIVSLQLAALGPVRFARSFALPMARAIGDAWAEQRLCVASEHMGSALLRSMLGTALRHTPSQVAGPVVLFATPSGERHEIGLLIAALVAMGAGASPRYFGADLPAEEVCAAAEKIGATAVALALVTLDRDRAEREVRAIRAGLPAGTLLWVGGAGAVGVDLPEGAEHLRSLEGLENRLALLGARASAS